MNAVSTYQSPLGELLLAADEEGLTGMWFQGQKYFAAGLGEETESRGLPVFEEAKRWLDLYFQGKQPDFFPALPYAGNTISEAGMGASSADSLWGNHNLWGACRTDRSAAGQNLHVCSGSRRRRGT